MDALDMLLSRRSIRKYGDKNVEEHKLQAMLRAAMAAPSAGNQQPWQFVVIRDRHTLDRVCEFHPYAQMCHEAALAILVCGDTGLERHEGFWVQDCSAATQNLLLAAHAQGLGAVWVGVHPREEREQALRALFQLPDGVIPFCLVAVGYPGEAKLPADRYQSTRVHHNSWGEQE